MKMFQKYPFTMAEMPYAFDALEPYISKKIIEDLYENRLREYMLNLNKIIENHSELREKNLTELLMDPNSLAQDIKSEVLTNAGGYYNLILSFAMMTPEKQPIFPGVAGIFGGEDNFRTEMRKAALSLDRPGFAWLTGWATGGVKIIALENQDNPFSFNCYPLLPLNMWEYAYQDQYGGDKNAYIDNWFNVINWNNVVDHCRERGCSCYR